MEERGWRRRRWSERGPAWQAVDVPAPRVVVCTSVTCVENIAAVVAGYRSLRVGANGKARCGTEQSWAQLLLFMLCGREADVQSDCVLPKVSWGLVSTGKLAGTRGSPEPSHQVCLFSPIHGQTLLLDHGIHFTCDSLLILSSSALIPPCCALEALAGFRFTFFFLLFFLKNNSKVPEKEVSMYMHAGVFGEGGN